DVGGVFDYLEGLAVEVEYWIVRSLDPDLLSSLADTLVLPGLVFAAIQLCPEFRIGTARTIGGIDEHAVVPTLDLAERVTDHIQKIRVGRDDRSVHVKFDDGLGFSDRRDLAVQIGGSHLLRGYIGSKFDDLERLALLIEDRIVGGEYPD